MAAGAVTPYTDAFWEPLEVEAKAIKGFINSISKRRFGTGLAYFDRTNFQLLPRSEWFNMHLLQQIVNLTNPDATFEAVQGALLALQQRVQAFQRQIVLFAPTAKDKCPPKSQTLLISLVRIIICVKEVAEDGLKQLADNYKSLDKDQKGASLSSLGQETFTILYNVEESLVNQLTLHFPSLKHDLTLERVYFSVKELLLNREMYRAQLRRVAYGQATGLTLPLDLVTSCKSDAPLQRSKPNIEALLNAARAIFLPTMAQAIPTQGGATSWSAYRPVRGADGSIIVETGVTGTCERDGIGSVNICNLYDRIDPQTNHLVMGAGAIDSPLKVKQIMAVIAQNLPKTPEKKRGRWAVHQLNSFKNEERLMHDVLTSMPLMRAALKALMPERKVSLLHINTAFNAATMFKSEDAKSFEQINLESLVQLIDYILQDATLLLNEQRVGSVLQATLDFIKKEMAGFDHAKQLSDQIVLLKELVSKDPSQAKLLEQSKVAGELDELEQAIAPKVEDVDDLLEVADELDRALRGDLYPAEKGPSEAMPKGDSWLPIDRTPPLLKKELETRQTDLKDFLNLFLQPLDRIVAELRTRAMDTRSPEIMKVDLLFRALKDILDFQFHSPESLASSHCAQIELFLFLYRLIDVKPIIICWSGLDRSGTVRAFADAQSQLERQFYDEEFAQLKIPLKTEKEFVARLRAQHKLYLLLHNLDSLRIVLYRMTNELIASLNSKLNLFTDLKEWQESVPSKMNLREALVGKIDQLPEDAPAKKEDLKNALYYLELVAAHLLGPEAEKTLFSSGVVGFRYHQDAKWAFERYFANHHPLQRLPLVIQTAAGHNIQLLTYAEAGRFSNDSLELTPAGKDILLRLSQLRAK